MKHNPALARTVEDLMTPDLITAQGVIFFAAGFETTASNLSTLSFNLAKNPDVQVAICYNLRRLIH